MFAVASIFAWLCVLLEAHGQAEEMIEYLANNTKSRNQVAMREYFDPKTSCFLTFPSTYFKKTVGHNNRHTHTHTHIHTRTHKLPAALTD